MAPNVDAIRLLQKRVARNGRAKSAKKESGFSRFEIAQVSAGFVLEDSSPRRAPIRLRTPEMNSPVKGLSSHAILFRISHICFFSEKRISRRGANTILVCG